MSWAAVIKSADVGEAEETSCKRLLWIMWAFLALRHMSLPAVPPVTDVILDSPRVADNTGNEEHPNAFNCRRTKTVFPKAVGNTSQLVV
ncbi:hypothetical protein SAICODRAFT_32400 [Saitoella complicata NRRL Y-17804]|uniref:uncharacterized protein n=1 Tax=Saitoella complicata (strain BCRC 22490 / CBS 7301 / JCM 7358 / NBRC 10748 / NRRL Y-17804) TaxID=698492 RepID=UPI000866E1CD|nr:uncharacterized protein SAICODRAFT_32400 [Saitoella complicata NRRL Y-17804]ODQ49634.1 hypothetical protein SAICODRAFT_32400 [Saitoella complicata NRRL Y-17804]